MPVHVDATYSPLINMEYMLNEQLISSEDDNVNGGDLKRVLFERMENKMEKVYDEMDSDSREESSEEHERDVVSMMAKLNHEMNSMLVNKFQIESVDELEESETATVNEGVDEAADVELENQQEEMFSEPSDLDLEAMIKHVKANPMLAKALATSITKWEAELLDVNIADEFNTPDPKKEVQPDMCPATPHPPEPPPVSLLSEIAQQTSVTFHILILIK